MNEVEKIGRGGGEDWGFILQDANYLANTEKTPLSASDREELKGELVKRGVRALRYFYKQTYACSPRTYACAAMKRIRSTLVARILRHLKNEALNLDIPAFPENPHSQTIAELLPDERQTLTRIMPLVDWEMVLDFFTPEEFRIFEARLHNVPCAAIARELGYTPGQWKRVWRNFQKRAAFILDLDLERRNVK